MNTIINNPESPDGLKRDAITLLTSLSKGTNNNIVALCDYGAYRTLIDVLINSQSSVLLLATLRKSIQNFDVFNVIQRGASSQWSPVVIIGNTHSTLLDAMNRSEQYSN